MKYTFAYRLELQFLGFRFHGWQQQPKVKTLHEAVDKTLQFTIAQPFKTIGIGRTDAKVSAASYFVQLFVNEAIAIGDFCTQFNSNAPADLKIVAMASIDATTSILHTSKIKTYHYYFCYGPKMHPFAAPLLGYFAADLDIDLMKEGATLFEGTHYFNKYCTQPSEHTQFERSIDSCVLEENTILTASFFPKHTYVLKVSSQGFLRYQIRLMMGVLVALGSGKIDMAFIKKSLLKDNDGLPLPNIASGSGLQLHSVDFVS